MDDASPVRFTRGAAIDATADDADDDEVGDDRRSSRDTNAERCLERHWGGGMIHMVR